MNIPSSVTAINEETFADCVALTSIEIPNSVTVIRRDAFTRCSKLNNVTIPNSVTSIGDYAFSSCYAFTSINIPNSVKSIGIHAFAYCRYATSLTIPASVTSIDNGAFRDCERLTSVTSYITDVFETSNDAFSNSEQATLYVPSGTLSDYQSTVDWNRFTKIVEMPSIYMSCTDQGKVIINDNFEFTNDIGEVSINNDAENTFVFKPNANYQLTKVLINGEDVTSSVKNNQLTTMIPAGSKMNVVFSQTTGDVNGDGKVDISDVVKLVNIILGGSTGEEPNDEAIEENGVYWGVYSQPAVDTSTVESYLTSNAETMLNNATFAIDANSNETYNSGPRNFYSMFVAYPSTSDFPDVYIRLAGSDGSPLDPDTINGDGIAEKIVTWHEKSYKIWVMYSVLNSTIEAEAVKIKKHINNI